MVGDIGLLENLGKALGVSVIELLSGESITNQNKACNMTKGSFYVCPVCGNIIHTTGEAVISCCGITLPVLEAEKAEVFSTDSTFTFSDANTGDKSVVEAHSPHVEIVEDEYFVTLDHPMTKDHYISFIAAISPQGIQMEKLYPEGPAQARFKIAGVRKIFACCNRHGLYEFKI